MQLAAPEVCPDPVSVCRNLKHDGCVTVLWFAEGCLAGGAAVSLPVVILEKCSHSSSPTSSQNDPSPQRVTEELHYVVP